MKYSGIITAIISSIFVSSASGQELTEQQKRRLHLPYVRAATDCYARTIASNNAALDLAVQGRWYDALSATNNACNAPAAAMIEIHDRLYGAGTGTTFFRGPYLEDLPRAIGTRLKESLARRAAEVEQEASLRKQRVSDAEKTRNLLRDRMYACTTGELADLVASSESAEVLATAAMTICNKEVQAALDAAMEVSRLDGASTGNLRDELHGVIKRNVVTAAVQAKASTKQMETSRASSPATLTQPAQPSASSLQPSQTCLKAASSVREGQLVEQEKLISLMLDMCRPEIENEARSKFLKDPSTPLGDLRAQALENAVSYAKSLLQTQ